MNLELYIARKVLNFKETKDSISGPIAKIAIFSIALSICVVICTVFIVIGFKKEVSNKITGFGGHIQISKFSSNISYETPPISSLQSFYPSLDTVDGIENIQIYAIKPGIIKTDDFNWDFFKINLVKGEILQLYQGEKSNKALISKALADILKLDVGDKFTVYFIQNPTRVRRLEICGLYLTTLEEFDKLYILADIQHIQKLNDWDSTQISGFEINLEDFNKLDQMTAFVREEAGYKIMEDGSVLSVTNIKEKNMQLFDWLGLFDMNVIFIIVIMIIVAGINMTSGLLIMVLEKTQMIGILKSMGAENFIVKRIFLYLSSMITLKGLLIGNIAGMAICYIQYKYQLLTLDPTAYFLNAVPIHFDFFKLFLINLGAFIAIFMVLLIPTGIISKITPSETIKYE